MSQEELKTENIAETQPDPVEQKPPQEDASKKEPEVVVEEEATKTHVEATPEPKDEESKIGEKETEKHVVVEEAELIAVGIPHQEDTDDGHVEEVSESSDERKSSDESVIHQRSVIDEERLLSVDINQIEDEDSSETLDEVEYLRRDRLSTQLDFFLHFGQVPSLSEISLSLDFEEEDITSRLPSEAIIPLGKDVGKFVNPLTGEDLDEEEEEEEDEVTERPHDDDDESSSEVLSDEIDLEIASIGSIKEEKPKEEAGDDDGLQVMFELMQEEPAKVGELDTLMLEREMERLRQLQIRESTIKFLNRIIDRAMDKADFVDPKEVLRNSLDKGKLLDQLYNDLIELEKERRTHSFLNFKMVEYYRRSKNFGPISPDPPTLVQKRYATYMEALKHLDFLLGKEAETIQMNEKIMREEQSKLTEMEESVQEAEEQLEKTILTTMVKPKSSPRWKLHVEKSLSKMAAARVEISVERLRVVKKQHTMAELAERLNKIENISPNFTMTMYERTMGKVIKLSDNLHDLDQNISKVNDQYHNVLHLLSHIREKRHMMLIQITEANKDLVDIKYEHNKLRDRLYNDKLKHVQLLAELQDLSYNVGLMDKPLLMHDYDQTVEDIEELTRELDDLRQQFSHQAQRSIVLKSKPRLKHNMQK